MAIHHRQEIALENVMLEQDVVTHSAARKALGALRITFGLIFLWAFLDKTFALGFHTGLTVTATGGRGSVDVMGKGAAWLNGGSPTKGFLASVPDSNPLSGIYHTIAGQAWADWLFMIGLLGIGVALTFGFAIRIAAVAGMAMYTLMYLAALPWLSADATHPFLDDHVVGFVVMLVLALTLAGDTWGLGRAWARTHLVRRYPALR
ncbi:MAG: hypothetical protein ACTHOK_08405 [Nocardioidaceae bacterium]